jgi:SHS2 domain-containing protein
MSKELIEMLRADAESTDDIGLCADAADRIEQLESALRGMMDAYNDLCDESEPNYRSFKFRQEKWEAANAALGK